MSSIDPKLLEVAFFQEGSCDNYTFVSDAMFRTVDQVCSWYDYTHELPESELHYTTYCEVSRNSRNMWGGQEYLVAEDFMGDFAIYKYVEEVKDVE